jgi:hypothetical protein
MCTVRKEDVKCEKGWVCGKVCCVWGSVMFEEV